MKTTNIGAAIRIVMGHGYDAIASASRDELAALEESHAEMAAALLAWVRAGESGNPSMIPDLDEQARAALRKAGLL